MTRSGIVRWCVTCRAEVAFEQPECPDGHGQDCPELVCVDCGDAVLVGFAPGQRVPLFRPTSSVA